MAGINRHERRVDSERHRRVDLRPGPDQIVNATERTALLQSMELYDEITPSIDERTMEILDHRRRTAIVRRRGWLVRRMLLLGDIVGLTGAFLLAELVSAVATPAPDRVATGTEL